MTTRYWPDPALTWFDPPDSEQVAAGGRKGCWRRLTAPYRIFIKGTWWIFPAGEEWNQASVPRLLRLLIDEQELGDAATLGHDLLYRYHGALPRAWLDRTVPGAVYRTYTRRQADQYLRLMGKIEGAPDWKSAAGWAAVRFWWGFKEAVRLSKPWIALLLLCSPAMAAPKTYGHVEAVVLEVYDGDTLRVQVDAWPPIIGERISVRVYGVDCRELSTGATAARDEVRRLIPVGSTVRLSELRRDKYFRLLADVGFNCQTKRGCTDLGDLLVKRRLAVPYFGGTKSGIPSDVR